MKRIFFILITTLVLFSCSDEEPGLTESFFKIYDDSNADLSYDPIDVVETIDGFIILTGTELNDEDFQGVQLIKVDQTGEFVSDTELTDYAIPVGDMFLIDSVSYFFAANPNTLQASLLGVNPQLELVVETVLGGINYPLSANLTSTNQLLLQSYDPLNLTSEISLIGLDGSATTDSYSIGPGDDVLEDVINHYLDATDRPLPFFCGEASNGNYYFNGFFNFSFSMVFTSLGGSPTSVVQGQATNAGVRAALPLGGGNFAMAGFQFTENYQLPSVALSGGNVADLYPGSDQAELSDYTPTKILSYSQSENANYTVFAAETEGRQIVLYFYDATSGEAAGLYNIGFINPFTFASMKVTDDNSLIVLGTTFVAGRFERVTLTKISAGEISDILN